ncbi:MAG: esterase-like activity of phytase family protein [Sphingomonas sp.]|uniref:esterase-like activity of phytase family protein n=1 Tax=Sphingomonas sp. TaxID=28214 RepID=UPI001AC5C80F|nr:esterase-like activity of phytase family protein [Sphingomonas sp.]MBN8808593.1 esterase-like activity of phytase family protein [Sphingomonas sp.]
MRTARLILLVMLCLTQQWSGRAERDILGLAPNIAATRVPLDESDPRRTRVGALTYLGGVALSSRDPAFGGFSSLSVAGDRFTLLSDGGNIVLFRMDAAFRIGEAAFGDLPAGPGVGWEKKDRDSESMTLDPATGQVWVGFERYNAIWRYAPGLRLPAMGVAPAAMRDWQANGGPEAMMRLHDGRFLVIAESDPRDRDGPRPALMFAGDPVAHPDRLWRFHYRPPAGYDVSDATELPDGRVLILNRTFALPFRWGAVLTVIDPRAVKPDQVVAGTEIARFAPPLTLDNYEGLAITREGDTTILWIVSDDNQLFLQRSLLLKFRLNL